MIEAFNVTSLIRNPVSGGYGGGAGGAGAYGLGDGTDPVILNFYTKRFGDETLWYEGSFALSQNFYTLTRAGYPILPSPQSGWRLAPYEEMYVALSKAVASPGLMVFARGGQYS